MSIGPLNENSEFARKALEAVVFGQCFQNYGNQSLAERISAVASILVEAGGPSTAEETAGRLQSIKDYLADTHSLLSGMSAEKLAAYTGELVDYAASLKQSAGELVEPLKPEFKRLGFATKHYKAFDSALEGTVQSNIKQGLVVRSPTWKQRSLFWKGLSDTLIIARFTVDYMRSLPEAVKNVASAVGIGARLLFLKDADQLHTVISGLRDTTSGFYHSLRIVSEVAESTPGVQFRTRTQKAISAAAILGSAATVSRLTAEASGFGSLAENLHLGQVGAFFAVARFFLGWNSTEPGKELVRIKDEMIEAFNEYRREYIALAVKDAKDDEELAALLKKTIDSQFEGYIKTLSKECRDVNSLRGFLTELAKMTGAEGRAMFSPALTKKCEVFIEKARRKMDEKAVLIVQKCDALSDHLGILQKLQAEAVQKALTLDQVYGKEDSHKKRWVFEGLTGYVASLTYEIERVKGVLDEQPFDALDISEWLKDVEWTIAPAQVQSFVSQLAYSQLPPSIIDDVHL